MARQEKALLGFAIYCLLFSCNIGALGQVAAPKSSPTINYESYQALLAHWLASSQNPRDRALATQLVKFDLRALTADERARNGLVLREVARDSHDDILLQWIWMISGEAESGCNPQDPCPERIRAATIAQPDNAASWIRMLSAAWSSGAMAEADAALTRMAAARVYREPAAEEVKAWIDAIDRFPVMSNVEMPESFATDPRVQVFMDAMSEVSLSPGYEGLTRLCSRARSLEDPQTIAKCARVAHLMLRAGTLNERVAGWDVLRETGMATTSENDEMRTLFWEVEQASDCPITGPESRTAQEQRQLIEDWRASENEIEVLHKEMRRAGIPLRPPASWQPRIGVTTGDITTGDRPRFNAI
jgi:hypothetical protein